VFVVVDDTADLLGEPRKRIMRVPGAFPDLEGGGAGFAVGPGRCELVHDLAGGVGVRAV